MTQIVVGVVDVVVLRRAGRGWRVLALERAPGVRSPGSWEIVHGSIERGESPIAAARREVAEETGLTVERLYSVTVNPFYLGRNGTIQLAVAFAAIVTPGSVTLGVEHQDSAWLPLRAAHRRLAWPRTHELLRHVAWLFRSGDAGAVEDVLRVTGDT